jgi:hypothetical protein
MAEQLGFDEILGQSSAVHDDQRTGPAGREMVKAFGDQLLARSSLADHEHGAIERRGAARPLDGVEEGKALADELVRSLHNLSPNFCPTVGGISHHLARIFDVFAEGNRQFFRNSALSPAMARSLYVQVQV